MALETVTRFLDQHNLPWLLLAAVSWLIIAFSCSRKAFWRGLPAGIWTMATGTILELFFINHKFWVERFIMIHIGELDLFVITGPFFSVGLLLIRFLPENRWGRYLAVLFWSGFATGIELLAVKLGFLEYQPAKWSMFHSIMAYFLGLMSALGFYYIFTSVSPAQRKPRPE